MHKHFTSLSFIIGLFFSLIAAVLLIGYFISLSLKTTINLYAGIAFLLFGIYMIWITPEDDSTST